jgi:hypothetical protein
MNVIRELISSADTLEDICDRTAIHYRFNRDRNGILFQKGLIVLAIFLIFLPLLIFSISTNLNGIYRILVNKEFCLINLIVLIADMNLIGLLSIGFLSALEIQKQNIISYNASKIFFFYVDKCRNIDEVYSKTLKAMKKEW